MGVGGGGIVVCERLLLLVGGSDDGRLLACLKMSNATSLGRWRGFRLYYKGGKRFFSVTPLRRSGN
jgi:hypothetical protein